MAAEAEAFNPFACDDGDDEFANDVKNPSCSLSQIPTSHCDVPAPTTQGSPHGTTGTSTQSDASTHGFYPDHGGDYAHLSRDSITQAENFPSLTIGNDTTDQFGFPSNCFPASFETDDGEDRLRTPGKLYGFSENLGGNNVIISEEMSVIHKSRTNQCSVKVRGTVWLENLPLATSDGSVVSCLSFTDPKGHIKSIATKSKVSGFAQPVATSNKFITGESFRISTLDFDGQDATKPLMEYTCGERLRPVPLLINSTTHKFSDRYQIVFQLRVNPRNSNPLVNAAVLVSVPDNFDGDEARAFSAANGAERSKIDTCWSDITRIMSWKLGDLHSGTLCEFVTLFPIRKYDFDGDVEPEFPVLLRYDSEGALLSDINIGIEDEQNHSPIKRKFRVYHRQI